jgi:nucleotide-binding universal stress UspA family protein
MNGTSTMLRRIVFPLDSSARSECALRYAAELASATEARLVLVRAADAAHHAGPGHALDALVDEIDRQKPDLVVMTTGDHAGLRHAIFGDVADAVVGAGLAPVLLLRQAVLESSTSRTLLGRRLLVPLDGSALAETALPAALQLARALHGELILCKAVVASSAPYAVPEELMTVHDVDVQLAWEPSFDVKAAAAYLSGVVDHLTHLAPDVVVHTRVHVGELVEQVRALDATAVTGTEPPVGLIVMATHGRTGLSQALLGSTAHDVLRATNHPLVVVHPRSVPANSGSVESTMMGPAST